jgi:hypothetical protein
LLYSSSQSEGVGDGVGGGVPFINKERFCLTNQEMKYMQSCGTFVM